LIGTAAAALQAPATTGATWCHPLTARPRRPRLPASSSSSSSDSGRRLPASSSDSGRRWRRGGRTAAERLTRSTEACTPARRGPSGSPTSPPSSASPCVAAGGQRAGQRGLGGRGAGGQPLASCPTAGGESRPAKRGSTCCGHIARRRRARRTYRVLVVARLLLFVPNLVVLNIRGQWSRGASVAGPRSRSRGAVTYLARVVRDVADELVGGQGDHADPAGRVRREDERERFVSALNVPHK
jgi:hypothetical protein